MDRRRFLKLAAHGTALAAMGSTVGCSRDRPRPSIVLVVVDSLRADRITVKTTPNLSRLAADSERFTDAVAAAPWTYPSAVAILTGQHPDALGVTSETTILRLEHENLAQRLGSAGYTAIGVTANPWLSTGNGLTDGFHVWDDAAEAGAADADAALDRSLRHIRASGNGPFFLYAHLNDCHWPYVARPRWLRDTDYAGPIRSGHPYDELLRDRAAWSARDFGHLAALYDSEVSYIDHELGRFLAALEADGRLQNTVVVVTSDHGEELGERGWVGHGWTLHRELLHVPLLIRWPGGGRRGTRVHAGHVDIATTLASAAGAGDFGLDGRDLGATRQTPWLFSRTVRRAFARRYRDAPVDLAAMSSGSRKVVMDVSDHTYTFYHLESDPDERAPLPQPRDQVDKSLAVALEKTLSNVTRRCEFSEPVRNEEIRESVRDRLRSLGYL